MVNPSDLEIALEEAWCKETSSDPNNWSPSNPAWGQCAVTSLIAQDYFGGEIVWTAVTLPNGHKTSHYFNLIDGEEKDFTRKQFREGTVIPKGVAKTKGYDSTKDYILSYFKTQERYKILKRLVAENLT